MAKPAASPQAPAAAAPRESLACLVVEDHTLIGQLLVGMLRTSPGIGSVMLATSVAAGIAATADEKVDLLILDLKLPDGDGLDVLRGAVKRNGDVACIVLSSMAEELICPQDLAPRVAAVIDKTAAIESLRFEVEAAVRRRLGGLPRARMRDAATLLRPRELEVFERIGKGMSTRAIAESLGITVHTVNTHRKAIVSKLGVVGAELVRLAAIHNTTRTGPFVFDERDAPKRSQG